MGKKILVVIAISVAAAVLALLFLFRMGAALLFTLNQYQNVEEGPFWFGTRDVMEQAIVYRYTWHLESEDPEDLEITIPDFVGDYPVKQLGNGDRSPFYINVEGRDFYQIARVGQDKNGSVAWDMEEGCELYYLDFTLNIGPTIEAIFPDHGIISGRSWGKEQIYCPRVYVNCDPDNPRYYSENGKLYDKKGKLVDFLYWDWVDPIAAPAA